MDKQSKQTEHWPDDDQLIFVPDEVYRLFFNAFDLMGKAQLELHKMAKEMKPIES